jgi:hypothetical protein
MARGSNLGRKKFDFSLLRKLQTGCGAYPDSYLKGIEVLLRH